MLFNDFSVYLAKLEKISSRLTMTEVLADLFKHLDREEIIVASYLLQGSLVPSYQSLEFQLSSKMLLRALASFGQAEETDLFGEANHQAALANLTKRYQDLGDLGDLFEAVLEEAVGKTSASLSIVDTHHQLVIIAQIGGTGSQDEKLRLLLELLRQLNPVSAKFISRIILGKMRLGFSTMTMLDALSWAKVGDKSEAALLERAFQKKADLGLLAQSYLFEAKTSAADLLQNYQMELGVPVVPSLCQRLNSAEEIIKKMGPVIAEPKYDGLRIQIHLNRAGFADGSQYKAYTRNLEEVSHMFPELEALLDSCQLETAIFDSEAIGVDPVTGKFFVFQETISRKRKYQVADKAAEVPICFYIFDLLYANGERLIDQTLESRKAKLAQFLPDSTVAKKTTFEMIADPEKLRQFHEQQLALGLEGAVMKQPNSLYTAGRKGWRWVKIKEAEGQRGKLNDTLDCIMLGYYFGKGKRQAFGIGALLVGVFDAKSGQIKTLSKIGTGLTDEQFRQVKTLADQHLAKNNQAPVNYDFKKELVADVWLEPNLVLEIAADEISQSPSHTAGVALRFPRLIKIRQDKNWEDATTLEELKVIKIA